MFIVNRGKIKERMDVEFHQGGIEILSKYEIVKLGNIAEFQYGLGEVAQESGDLVYIRITDIDEFGMLKKNDLKYITEKANFETSILKKGDILVARTGATFGKTLYFNEDFRATYGGFLIRIKLDTDLILPKYYFYFTHTNLYWQQAKQLVGGGGQPQFNANAVKQLQIPLPPLEIQNQIVAKMDEALAKKTRKEAEAKSLLAGIDEFVLGELGIEYEAVEEKKMFGLKLSKLDEGKRFDPYFNNPSFNNFRKLKSKFDVSTLENLIIETKTGLPIRSDYRVENGEYPYYGANGIIGYMDKFTHDGNYIIAGQDGYIGNHYIVEGKFRASNHNRVMKFKDGIDLHYIKSVLDVIDYDYLITGGVIPKLTREALLSIQIPVPSLDVQKQIADEVKRRIETAKQLESEAREVYEKAKGEVEREILDF